LYVPGVNPEPGPGANLPSLDSPPAVPLVSSSSRIIRKLETLVLLIPGIVKG